MSSEKWIDRRSCQSKLKKRKGNLCRPRPTVLHVPLWKGSSFAKNGAGARPSTYSTPLSDPYKIVENVSTCHRPTSRPSVSSSDCPGSYIPGRSMPGGGHSDNLARSMTALGSSKVWPGRARANNPFRAKFGARPGCDPASGHPLTLGVRPSLGPLRWSKQAETWPDPRTSWVASGAYFRARRWPIKRKFVSSRIIALILLQLSLHFYMI